MFIIRYKIFFISLSATLVALGIASLVAFGINPGIEFTGGSLAEISYPEGRPEIETLQMSLNNASYDYVTVLPTGDNGVFLKSRDLTEEERSSIFGVMTLGGEAPIKEESFTSIGPSLGKELATKTLWALLLVMVVIALFVAYAFRHVSKPVSSWRYGMVVIVSLLHDVVVTAGIFAIISHFTGGSADSLFVVALLTVLGLSINDTIVVFDRIRENLKNYGKETFDNIVGDSITQTFARSINTSLSTVIVLVALVIFGPDTTRMFAITLAIGMIIGTYSSIFLASPLLVLMKPKEEISN